MRIVAADRALMCRYDLAILYDDDKRNIHRLFSLIVFGKKIGGDIINNKKTWLLTRALEKGEELEASGVIDPKFGKAALLRAMEMKTGNEADKSAKIAKVTEIYEALGIDEDVKYEIIKLHAQAMNYAGMIGLSKVRYEMLHRYADRLLGRNR